MDRSPVGTQPELSIIVPVLDEVANLDRFLESTSSALADAGIVAVEYVFVDDGSSDGTWRRLKELSSSRPDIVALKLSRNWGKEAALAAGLKVARGDAHIPMDVDLQDPPEVVVEMYRRWKSGARVVLARRISRDEGPVKRATAEVFYRLASRGAVPIPRQVGDFRLMDAAITARYLELPERARFNKGLLAFVASEVEVVDFARPNSRTDASKQNWRRLIRLAFDGLVSFSDWPLRLFSGIGFAMVALSILGAILSVVLYVAGVLTVPGQATVILFGLFAIGFQAVTIGMLGEYVARILVEVKSRPLYFVDEIARPADALDPDQAQ